MVTVRAMSSDGFRDNTWGVVAVALEDLNRNPIEMGGRYLKAYDASTLSSSLLNV